MIPGWEKPVLARYLMSLVLSVLVACGGNPRAPVEDRVAQSVQSVHTVKRGDTLYSIAFRYGLDYREVAAANGIGAPYTIYPGQRIMLTGTVPAVEAVEPVASVSAPPRSTPAAPPAVPPASPVPIATTPTPTIATRPPVRESPAPTSPVAPPPAAEQKVTPVPAAAVTGGKVDVWLWPAAGPVTRGYSGSVHKGIDIGGARGDPVVAVADGTVVYAGTGIVGFGELLIVKHNAEYLSAYGHNERLLVAEGEAVRAGQTIAHKGSSGTDSVKLHFEIRKGGKPIDPQRVLPRR